MITEIWPSHMSSRREIPNPALPIKLVLILVSDDDPRMICKDDD
jgi:hypothetical protein